MTTVPTPLALAAGPVRAPVVALAGKAMASPADATVAAIETAASPRRARMNLIISSPSVLLARLPARTLITRPGVRGVDHGSASAGRGSWPAAWRSRSGAARAAERAALGRTVPSAVAGARGDGGPEPSGAS